MSNKIRIKICGMCDPENILQVAQLQPDYMGFIFYPKSKRFVGDDFRIPEQLPSCIKRVGVFVNESTIRIMELTVKHQLNLAQLHGFESVDQCAEIKASGLGVVKAFQMGVDFDFSELNPYKKNVDYFLFDTKSDSYGGTGKVFDWKLLSKYDQEVPFFLSGGLSLENIQGVKAMKGMNLHALDVNSGVELSPGQKDIGKVKNLKSQISNLKS